MPSSAELASMAGRVAFIAGAASGIGRATALAFPHRRANVVIADIDESANRTARMIEGHGGQVLAVAYDVTSSADVHHVLDCAA